jgi:hypothetical protein
METTTLTRPSRGFLLAVLLLSAAGALTVCRQHAWRWSEAEAVARSFAAAALAGDEAALARLGTAQARAADALRLEPGDARRCLANLRFIEGRTRGEGNALLLFDGPDACPLGYRPALFLMQRTGDGWRVRDLGFFPVQRDGRVAAIDIPTM